MQRSEWLALLLTLFLPLAGCVNVDVAGKSAKPTIAYFDLAGSVPGDARAPSIGLARIDVVAPTWLDTSAMQYRLTYADASRRSSFAESRWAAPPPELFRQSLRRTLSSVVTSSSGGGCRLLVDIDEFIQTFDTPQSSVGLVELRASLLAPRADLLLAGKNFRATRPAPSADARGGVAALAAATGDVSSAIRQWLDGLDSGAAGDNSPVSRCRSG